MAFYPIFLNTAQSVRTTVEALETRGFTYATVDQRGRNIRLAYLKVGALDLAVVAVTIILVAGAFWFGQLWPVYHVDLLR